MSTKWSAFPSGSTIASTDILVGLQGGVNVQWTGAQVNTLVTGGGALSIASGKTLTVSNTLTLAGTDTSTLNIGAGGTLNAISFITPGTGVATALAVNVGSAGAFVTFNGALGTPSSGTATNLTGLPISTGVSGLGTGVATALALNVNGSGAVSLTTSPTFVTPVLGAASATSITIGAGAAITSSGAGGALGTNAFTSTAYAPLASPTFTGTVTFPDTSTISSSAVTLNTPVSVVSTSFGLSGNISATAWTTNGLRYKNIAGTLTDTSSSGTVAAAYTDVWGGNTIAASNATTFTNYYGAYFKIPVAGTNVTFTNAYAIGADSIASAGLLGTTSAGTAAAPSVFVGNKTTGLYSVSTTGFGIAINGVVKGDWGITSGGSWSFVGNVSSNGSFSAGNGSVSFASGNSGSINFASNGVFTLLNNAGTSFGRLQFGGVTSSFPSIKRNSAALNFRLADDSADAAITTAGITASAPIVLPGYTVAGLPAGTSGGMAYVTDAVACTFLATVTGGGSTVCPVFYNGAAWVGA